MEEFLCPGTPARVLLSGAGVQAEHTLYADTQLTVFSHCSFVWTAVSVTMGAVPGADMVLWQFYAFAPWSSWQSYSPLAARPSVKVYSV